MANDLTGDYQIVAQFTVGAVNRVLAGMHAVERFPHSISARVDDSLESAKPVRAAVDLHGKALTDVPLLKRRGNREVFVSSGVPAIGCLQAPPGAVVSSPAPPKRELDMVSNLRGAAQLQLGAPALELPAGGGTTAATTTAVLIRYVPDVGTPALPEFCRGVFRTAFAVEARNTPSGSFIEAATVGENGGIQFEPFPAGSVDRRSVEAINKVLRSVLGSGFHPSTSPVPANIAAIDFKALPAAGAIAVMINRASRGPVPPPDPASVTASFVRGGDFAVAVNSDLIARTFAGAVNDAVPERLGFRLPLGLFDLAIGVDITRREALVKLADAEGGRILLTIPIRVQLTGDTLGVSPTDFELALQQAFVLSLDGSRIQLVPAGGPTVEAGAAPAAFGIRDRIRSEAATQFNNAWRDNQATIQARVDEAFAGANLQQIVSDLLNPPHIATPMNPGPAPIHPLLSYTSVEIRRAGIVLHGTVSLPEWPPVHAEFDLDPWTAASRRQDYSALNSWVPGGNIGSFVWSFGGIPQPARSDSFLAATDKLNRVCLQVNGSRISASGPVTASNPFAATCREVDYGAWSIPADFSISLYPELPTIAVLRPALQQDGAMSVAAAHASPWAEAGKKHTVNLLVHFADANATAPVELLAAALEQSGRTDTDTRVVCVVAPEQLRKTRKPSSGVVLLSDDVDAWKRLFCVQGGPETLLLSPAGTVEWRQKGPVDSGKLAAELKQRLRRGGYARPFLIETAVRAGQIAPDFIFETGVGNSRLSIRKLVGRQAILVFWRDAAPASVDMVQRLEQAACSRTGFPPIIAIHDGRERRHSCSQQPGATQPANWLRHTTLVPDPERRISQAYGVKMWPTVVTLGKDGRIGDIRQESIPERELNPPSSPKLPPPSPNPGKDCSAHAMPPGSEQ